jgi:molecular chaperone DnaK
MGEQLDDATKAEINEAVSELKAVLDSDDVDAIKAKTEAVQTAFHKASEQVYQQAAAEQQAGDSAASGNGASANDEEEVVDAEVVDEDRS